MSEYIKREQVLKLLESAQAWGWSMDTLHGEIQALPDADVAPMIHGKWLEYQNEQDRGFHYCSNCKDQAFNYNDDNNEVVEVLSNYCSRCGAKMDLEDGE